MEFRRVLFRSRNRFLDTPNTVAAEFNPQLQFSARYLLLENSQPALQFSLRNYSSIYIVGSEIAVSQPRSEEHTSELQSLMRISYAVFCLKKKNKNNKL